jgi:hypothetical protein
VVERSGRVTRDVVERVGTMLRELPPKAEANALHTREAVAELKADILQARANGYSLAEIIEHMRANGLAASESTLKAGIRTTRTASKPTVRKGASTKPSASARESPDAPASAEQNGSALAPTLTPAASRRNER